MADAEDVIAPIAARIRAMAGGDISRILEPAALTEADDALRAAVAGDQQNLLDVMGAVAWLHWYRGTATAFPEEDRLDEVAAALRLFLPVAQVDPYAVPPPALWIAAKDNGLDAEPSWQLNTAAILMEHLDDLPDPDLLDVIIDMLTAAADEFAADDLGRAATLSNLGSALQQRFHRNGALPDLDRSIETGRRAVSEALDGDLNMLTYLRSLHFSLNVRFETGREDDDLGEMIAVGRSTLAIAPSDGPDRSSVVAHDLGRSLYARFLRSSDPADLDGSVEALQQAASLEEDAASLADCTANLILALRVRYDRVFRSADLEEIIDLCLRAQVMESPDPFNAEVTAELASGYYKRFLRDGSPSDLDAAVPLLRTALAGLPDGSRLQSVCLSNLGMALQTRFARDGDVADLDEAVRCGRAAVSRTPVSDQDRALYLSNLGNALRVRFERNGAGADVDEAIRATREAIAMSAHEPSERARFISNLGISLRARFARNGAVADLDESIDLGREAVTALPAGHPDRGKYLSNLAIALNERFVRDGDRGDGDDAIASARLGIESTPPSDPNLPMYLTTLGIALGRRFSRSGDVTDLFDSIATRRKSLAMTSRDSASRAIRLVNLGTALVAQFALTSDSACLDEAIQFFREARESKVAGAHMRLVGAANEADTLARWTVPAHAVDAYSAVVTLLPLLAWNGVPSHDQQRLLAEYGVSAGSDAAACALAADRSETAVELTEHGRNVLWSQLLAFRTDLTELQRDAPKLAERMLMCRTSLDRPTVDL